jgi:hypothetical protein
VLRETTSRGVCGLVCPSRTCVFILLCVFITAGPIIKLCGAGCHGADNARITVRVFVFLSGWRGPVPGRIRECAG